MQVHKGGGEAGRHPPATPQQQRCFRCPLTCRTAHRCHAGSTACRRKQTAPHSHWGRCSCIAAVRKRVGSQLQRHLGMQLARPCACQLLPAQCCATAPVLPLTCHRNPGQGLGCWSTACRSRRTAAPDCQGNHTCRAAASRKRAGPAAITDGMRTCWRQAAGAMHLCITEQRPGQTGSSMCGLRCISMPTLRPPVAYVPQADSPGLVLGVHCLPVQELCSTRLPVHAHLRWSGRQCTTSKHCTRKGLQQPSASASITSIRSRMPLHLRAAARQAAVWCEGLGGAGFLGYQGTAATAARGQRTTNVQRTSHHSVACDDCEAGNPKQRRVGSHTISSTQRANICATWPPLLAAYPPSTLARARYSGPLLAGSQASGLPCRRQLGAHGACTPAHERRRGMM